jgi:hypothetical protein
MNEIATPQKSTKLPQKTAVAGRVFKISLEGVPPVDARMWEKIKAAARTPRPEQRYPAYPEIIDVPETSR